MKAMNLTDVFKDLRELNQQCRMLLQIHAGELPIGLSLKLALASGQLETIFKLLVEADVVLTFDEEVQSKTGNRATLTQVFEGDESKMRYALSLWAILQGMWKATR